MESGRPVLRCPAPRLLTRGHRRGAHSSDFVNNGGNEIGGQLAFFSSFGPTLDERLKPSISAPGVNVESSLSSFRDGIYNVTETFDYDGRRTSSPACPAPA